MRRKCIRNLAGSLAACLCILLCTGQPLTAGDFAAEFAGASFHEEAAEGNDAVKIDLSATSEGVVALSAVSSKKVKVQTLYGDVTYTYDLPNDGTPGIFPLQSGSGHYGFRVLENVTGTKYGILFQTEADVVMENEFQPFLRPSDYAYFTEDSACVKKAAELAAAAADANAFVTSVYDFVCSTVKYDQEKAMTVTSGYLPNPDETMATGKGICFDYASLAAAMLRSQGVPTKVIFGYVSPDELYHAWNMFYTEDSGWVTVDYQVSGESWNRLDLTFSANGADGQFIGNGSNYTDMFFY